MPIRFRCGYCEQLMSIARRKAGTVVSCPKCAGQMIVPPAEDDDPPPPPPKPKRRSKHLAPELPAPEPKPAAVPKQAAVPTPAARPTIAPLGVPRPGEVAFDFESLAAPQTQATPDQPAAAPLRARRPPNRAGWRFVSPAFLVGALLMSALPWLEIRCDGPEGTQGKIVQSGFQMASGRAIVPSEVETEFEKVTKAHEGEGGEHHTICPACRQPLYLAPDSPSWMPGRCPRCKELFNPTSAIPIPLAPLVGVFLSLVLSAVFSSLIIRSVFGRVFVVGVLALGALGVLAYQAIDGFPLDRSVQTAMERDQIAGEHISEQWVFKTHYTPWFGGTVLLVVLALVLLALELAYVRRLRAQMAAQRTRLH